MNTGHLSVPPSLRPCAFLGLLALAACDPVVTLDDETTDTHGEVGTDGTGAESGPVGDPDGATTTGEEPDPTGAIDTGEPPAEPVCGNGVAEDGESCDGDDFAGWSEDAFEPSCEIVLGGSHHGWVTCTPDCTMDTSQCTSCGDGVVQPAYEACEPGLGETIACDRLRPGLLGEAECDENCQFDSSSCELACGNGVLDPGEACDSESFANAATCTSEGFVGGDLQCNSYCELVTSDCHSCGDGVVGPGEACDGLDFDARFCASFLPGATGELACDETCEISLDGCVATGATVVISEVMAVPLGAPLGSAGEWFEVHNPSPSEPFDLVGCEVQGQVLFESFTFQASLVLEPGAFLTLGKGTPEQLGFTPDFELPAQTNFLNDGDLIRIECGGLLVDEVTYGGADWPLLDPGVSITVDAGSLSPVVNDAGPAWCASADAYGVQLFGTPGAAGACPP